MGVGAEETRQALPRRAEVPFDSEYKFMATFHDRPDWLAGPVITRPHLVTVKGAPDVVLDHCDRALWHGRQVPIGAVRDDLLTANRKLSERGLRVLAFAARDLDDAAMAAALADPMAAVTGLVFIALVGIVDPLRTEARDAVHAALGAGIDVRMITGDHTITARANARTRSPRSDSLRLAARSSSRTVPIGTRWPCHRARSQRSRTTSR